MPFPPATDDAETVRYCSCKAMSLTFRWVGEDELDRVAETRMYCYAPATRELERFRENIRADRRGRPGDYLLAERNGLAVGTTTSFSMIMWVRGVPLPCQGVAYVGTIKTHRRVGSGGEKGIASQLMHETLRKARERHEVISALMPFRVSYYEHFGYGLVETRHDWTVPLSILPQGDFRGFNFVRSDQEVDDMMECRRRMVESGQCDIERSREAWTKYRKSSDEGYEVIDRGADGVVHGLMFLTDTKIDNKTLIEVEDQAWDSPEALRRQLHFLASLKDQYSGAILSLPRDVPLNRMLRETQVPNGPRSHASATLLSHTRMQVRVLDHKRFLEALQLPRQSTGRVTVTVAVHECEQTVSRFRVEIADGRCHVSGTDAAPDIECADKTWAAIACGEISATQAAQFGLIRATSPESASVLDALSVGPAPFCAEYF